MTNNKTRAAHLMAFDHDGQYLATYTAQTRADWVLASRRARALAVRGTVFLWAATVTDGGELVSVAASPTVFRGQTEGTR